MKDKRPKLTRLSAIRAFCFECFGFEMKVRECTDESCPLYEYRMGPKEEGVTAPLRPDHYRRFQVRAEQSKAALQRLSRVKEKADPQKRKRPATPKGVRGDG